MKRTGIALLWMMCAAGAASATDNQNTSTPSRQVSLFVVAQNDSCLRACQEANKSCLAKVDPSCNSRGCVNERNACTSDYNDCAKKCGK
jgi:hypothetical protein